MVWHHQHVAAHLRRRQLRQPGFDMPADVAAQFLPDSDYARAGVVDYQKMAAVQEAFAARYLNEVK